MRYFSIYLTVYLPKFLLIKDLNRVPIKKSTFKLDYFSKLFIGFGGLLGVSNTIGNLF